MAVVPVIVTCWPAVTMPPVAGEVMVVAKSSWLTTCTIKVAWLETMPCPSVTVYGIKAVPRKPGFGVKVTCPELFTEAVPPFTVTVCCKPDTPGWRSTVATLMGLLLAPTRSLAVTATVTEVLSGVVVTSSTATRVVSSGIV